MNNFHFFGLETELCDHVRTTRTDPIFGYDYDVRVSVAGPDGYGPCRQCLNTFSPGESRLLFLHNPFGAELGDFAAPVFIHEAPCTPLTPGPVLADSILALPLMVRGYDARGHFVAEQPVTDGELIDATAQLFEQPHIDIVHVRNTEAKCFVVAAKRGQPESGAGVSEAV